MSHRELIVLGSASQVPTRHRNQNGYLMRWDQYGFLFDPGEGTQRQMTLFGQPASAISHVLVTHFHGDHCLGLPGVLQRLSLDDVKHPVEVHYPSSGQHFFERLRYASVYEERATVIGCPIGEPGVIFEAPDLKVFAGRLDHRVETYGFCIREPDSITLDPDRLAAAGIRGPDIGRLARDGVLSLGDRTIRREEMGHQRRGQSMALVMDTRVCDAAVELVRGVDLLVCESTYLEEHREMAHSNGHLTARQAAELALESGARKLVLTHFSRRYANPARFLAEAREVFGNTVLAEDGLRVPLLRDSRHSDAIPCP